MISTPGNETESSIDAGQGAVPPVPSPKLVGLKVFVYVVSIFAGLAAGGLVADIIWEGDYWLLDWPDITGRVSLFAGILGGIAAAWFWTKMMTRHVRNYKSPCRLALYGILWGLLSGWVAAIILWVFEGFLFMIKDQEGIEIAIVFGVGYCGSIGGLGAGVLCGVVWAIWARPK
ncbi:MAG: hypothetical protein JW849_05360 [Phycisphaerae bacterium]|nr:hypothetical protein [Phycisphaerae bacterium]